MDTIKKHWKLISAVFVLGFALATLAWAFCIVPTSISIFGFEYALPDCPRTQKDLCREYGFEIDEPQGGYILADGQVRINGSVKELPPYGSAWLMTIADSNPVSYWPQTRIRVDPTSRKWNGVIYSSYDVKVAVVMLGDDGKILFDYFSHVVDTAIRNNAPYPGFDQLTKDVQTCVEVEVRRQ